MTTTNLYNQVYVNFGKLGLSQMQLHLELLVQGRKTVHISLNVMTYSFNLKKQNLKIDLKVNLKSMLSTGY